MIREEIKQTILDFKSVEEGYLSSFYLKVRLRKNLKTIVDKKYVYEVANKIKQKSLTMYQ